MTKREGNGPTPMMAQWHLCKKKAKDAILLFRMGDFYEAFYEDAEILARAADLTLTKRQGIPMSGVPHHTCEAYVDKLIGKGLRVAIADQMEDPKKAKGLVKRGLTRIVTPGTIVTSSLLSEKANNFFASVVQIKSIFGISFLDLTTSEFYVVEFECVNEMLNELYKLRPSEFLVSEKFYSKYENLFHEMKLSFSSLVSRQEDWHFDYQMARDNLKDHFNIHSLDSFGLQNMNPGICAAGALLNYLQNSLANKIDHIKKINTYSNVEYLSLDVMTQRNLELTESRHGSKRDNTLLEILDLTLTPMGGRLINKWIKRPLLSPEKIEQRQLAVMAFINNNFEFEKVVKRLEQVKDLERLIMKVQSGYALPRDLVALKNSLENAPKIKEVIRNLPSKLLLQRANEISDVTKITSLIENAIVDDPPAKLRDGKVFREGYNQELDELREISSNSKAWIARYQSKLREEFDIKTLKIAFNKSFGYYIEVSRGQSDKMPDSFQRRQTLVNAERFISPELKEYEEKVLHAEDKISVIQNNLFVKLREQIAQYSQEILQIAQAIAQIDVLQSFANVANSYNYICPKVDNGDKVAIEGGRHPVIENSYLCENFIPNDTLLDDKDRLLLITGPNMAGKSTYIRQVAIIVIMAQIGSFVPARRAHIGTVDKVFTRIGASDDLARGQSTFMVEMIETANILNNVTEKSLVILDEIGRGTSTYDGISLAWSIAEHLLTEKSKRAKTLFATHYFELTKLEEVIPGALNYNVAVQENRDQIVFMHKIVRGSADRSYGIHVAKLAGLPPEVIRKSEKILKNLERRSNKNKNIVHKNEETTKYTQPQLL